MNWFSIRSWGSVGLVMGGCVKRYLGREDLEKEAFGLIIGFWIGWLGE